MSRGTNHNTYNRARQRRREAADWTRHAEMPERVSDLLERAKGRTDFCSVCGRTFRSNSSEVGRFVCPWHRKNSSVRVVQLPVTISCEKIAEFCHARGIRKLSLFGSVLWDYFDPQRSDVDVLAELGPGVRPRVMLSAGEALGEII